MEYFRAIRIISTTRPNLEAGLLVSLFKTYHDRTTIEQLDAEKLGFYVDRLVEDRGEEAASEEYMLQASPDGRDGWIDIKPIVPLEGDLVYDEDDFGDCAMCSGEMTESDFALGDLCESCRIREHEEAAIRAEIALEQQSERQLFAGDYI